MRRAPIGVACRADDADNLAAGETSALDDPVPIRTEVRVVVDEALALVAGVDREAAVAIVMEPDHPTGVGREDGRSARCEDVDGTVDAETQPRGARKVSGTCRGDTPATGTMSCRARRASAVGASGPRRRAHPAARHATTASECPKLRRSVLLATRHQPAHRRPARDLGGTVHAQVARQPAEPRVPAWR